MLACTADELLEVLRSHIRTAFALFDAVHPSARTLALAQSHLDRLMAWDTRKAFPTLPLRRLRHDEVVSLVSDAWLSLAQHAHVIASRQGLDTLYTCAERLALLQLRTAPDDPAPEHIPAPEPYVRSVFAQFGAAHVRAAWLGLRGSAVSRTLAPLYVEVARAENDRDMLLDLSTAE